MEFNHRIKMGKFRKYNNKENIIMEEKLEDGNLQLLRPNEQDIIIQVFFAQNLLVPVDRIMIINFKHKNGLFYLKDLLIMNLFWLIMENISMEKVGILEIKENKIFGNYRAGIKLKSGILKSIQRGRLDSVKASIINIKRRSRIQSIWIKGDQWGAQFR